jgi:protein SCO1/2
VTSTLGWWAFAFMPLPSAPPEWLSAARAACFGAVDSGVPASYGWILLILAPASFLVAALVLWGSELVASVRAVLRSPAGLVAAGLLGIVAIIEGGWVAAKLEAARGTEAWMVAARPLDGELPPAYPRQSAMAPDFALVDQYGDTISLARFRGRPVVLTFVFGHCQTLCPLVVSSVKQATPESVSGAVLLVTLDPWRDTPSQLATISRQWQLPPGYHLLSARTGADVLRVVEAYRVPHERSETTGDIVHPPLVFLIDPEGRLAYTFSNPSPGWIRAGLDRARRAHVSSR